MRFDLERRIANALKRVHAQIEEQCGDALWQVGQEGITARHSINEAFITANRSLAQFRRHRNKATDYSFGTPSEGRPSANGG